MTPNKHAPATTFISSAVHIFIDVVDFILLKLIIFVYHLCYEIHRINDKDESILVYYIYLNGIADIESCAKPYTHRATALANIVNNKYWQF